jgi:hypothetical protein
MHPRWQIKRIVTIDGQHHVDRCNSFGGSGSCRLFCTFMSLVLWIADHIKSLYDLFAYIDDVFSYDRTDLTVYYAPYDSYLPHKQACLLSLWDELGIPHEAKKQVFGSTLRIIGFEVDSDLMTVSMDLQDREKLHAAIMTFCNHGTPTRRSLHEFQQLAGWINWSLNIAPRPGRASQPCMPRCVANPMLTNAYG